MDGCPDRAITQLPDDQLVYCIVLVYCKSVYLCIAFKFIGVLYVYVFVYCMSVYWCIICQFICVLHVSVFVYHSAPR